MCQSPQLFNLLETENLLCSFSLFFSRTNCFLNELLLAPRESFVRFIVYTYQNFEAVKFLHNNSQRYHWCMYCIFTSTWETIFVLYIYIYIYIEFQNHTYSYLLKCERHSRSLYFIACGVIRTRHIKIYASIFEWLLLPFGKLINIWRQISWKNYRQIASDWSICIIRCFVLYP